MGLSIIGDKIIALYVIILSPIIYTFLTNIGTVFIFLTFLLDKSFLVIPKIHSNNKL